MEVGPAQHADEHANRGRARIIRALVSLVAEAGLDAVSVRHVAARAGVTGGMVQHHFPTKHGMLLAAMAEVSTRVAEQIDQVRAERPPADALREICRLLVPLDGRRATDGRVWLAFIARAAVDDELAAEHRKIWLRLENLLAELLAAAEHRKRPAARDRTAAGLLLATMDGLAVTGLVEPDRLPPRRIDRLLSAQLGALLPETP